MLALAQRTALDWVHQQLWAHADHNVLEGKSAGGLATVALYATNRHQSARCQGCISFSGGSCGASAPFMMVSYMMMSYEICAMWRCAANRGSPSQAWLGNHSIHR
jgi:hypothetical protein